jgi:hypothetical protein
VNMLTPTNCGNICFTLVHLDRSPQTQGWGTPLVRNGNDM